MNQTQEMHAVVSVEQWLTSRMELLKREKELTRQRDELSRLRLELPWTKVEKEYVFDGPNGQETLRDLFAGRQQLMIYHFMLGPGWGEGCKSCSFLADHIDGSLIHLANRDVTLAVVSRAPRAEIEPFQRRMGWRFKWLSSCGNNFNIDYRVSFTPDDMAKGEVYYNYGIGMFPSDEAPGISVFFKDDSGDIFHTYSAYARGLDILLGAYNFMDLTPKGRDEDELGFKMSWVQHHDRYAKQVYAPEVNAPCCHADQATA